MHRTTLSVALLFALLVTTANGTARGESLSLSFVDPIGDHTGNIDVSGMTMNFDNSTGVYEIFVRASNANPFLGNFRVNINLFNPDTGTTDPDPSLFQDTFNDFDLRSPLSEILLTGTNSRLLSWEAGDRVATTSTPFGNPTGTGLFRSAVGDFPLGPPGVREDIIAQGNVFGTVVPEPGSLIYLGFGMACLGLVCWRRQVAGVTSSLTQSAGGAADA